MNVRVWLLAGLVAVASFAVFAASPVVTVSDSRWTLPAAISLERHGDLDIDEYRPIIQIEGGYGIDQGRGHTYNYFPYGTSVLIAPVVWLADVAKGRTMEAAAQEHKVESWEHLLAALIVGLAAGVMFLVAFEVLGSVGLALLGAGVFALGTAAWSTASRALWMHGPDMLLFSIALLLAVKSSRRPVLAGLTGLPLAMAFVVRPTAAAAVIAFAGWVAWQHRRQLLLFIACGAAVAIPFYLANLSMYGRFTHPYYAVDRYRYKAHFLEAVAGNLISPARGVLVFTPVLLCLALRRRKLTPLDWTAVAVIVIHLVLISRFWQWWGGYAFGPRLFSDVIPFFVFLLLPVLKDVRKPAVGAPFAVLLALSVFIQWRGATDIQTWYWNSSPVSVDAKTSRLWDWGDLQFLRGF